MPGSVVGETLFRKQLPDDVDSSRDVTRARFMKGKSGSAGAS
ncbi:MAG TPA: hypothetical protein VGH98_14750 [Gemmatimonadaceae bacterium]